MITRYKNNQLPIGKNNQELEEILFSKVTIEFLTSNEEIEISVDKVELQKLTNVSWATKTNRKAKNFNLDLEWSFQVLRSHFPNFYWDIEKNEQDNLLLFFKEMKQKILIEFKNPFALANKKQLKFIIDVLDDSIRFLEAEIWSNREIIFQELKIEFMAQIRKDKDLSELAKKNKLTIRGLLDWDAYNQNDDVCINLPTWLSEHEEIESLKPIFEYKYINHEIQDKLYQCPELIFPEEKGNNDHE